MQSATESVLGFDRDFLDILACPVCRGPLVACFAPLVSGGECSPKEASAQAEQMEQASLAGGSGQINRADVADGSIDAMPTALICRACALVYPVRDAIPVLLPEEASRLNRTVAL